MLTRCWLQLPHLPGPQGQEEAQTLARAPPAATKQGEDEEWGTHKGAMGSREIEEEEEWTFTEKPPAQDWN